MKEIITRSVSGALYILILIACIFFSEKTFLGLFFVFGVVCLYELQRLLHLKSYFSYLIFIGFMLYFSFLRLSSQYALYLLLFLTICVKLILLRDLFATHKIPLFERKKYILVIFYLISSVIFLTLLPYQHNAYHPELLFGIFILIWVNDTFAYLVGKNIGKQKLFERISPKKTVEGFFGGMLFSLIASYLFSMYSFTFNYKIWMGIAILVSIFGTFGDLIQSKLKRQANVKDSGNIMPGHGGLFDRLDSILFAGTFIYTFLLILNY